MSSLSPGYPYGNHFSTGHHRVEIDLVLTKGRKKLTFEIKASLTPHLSRGFTDTIKALKPERVWVICPMTDGGYPISSGARVLGISECLKEMESYL